MTEAATARRRPSPRPRPADTTTVTADERPTLQLVPPPVDLPPVDPETCNLNPATDNTPTPEITNPQVSASDSANADVVASRIAGLWAATKAAAGRTGTYWTPPSIATDQPASLAELAHYSRHAPWTTQPRGSIRKAGTTYWAGIALPYTAVSRYREWVVQRPGRLIAHLAAIKVLTATTPGIWVVDHLVYPVARLAGHVFL